MSEGPGHFPPLWLRGNFLLFGAMALALVVFVGMLAFIIGRPGRKDAPQPARNAFQDLNVELGDRATVDLQTKSFTITLKFPGLPEEAARSMTVKVSIDGEDAQVSDTGVGNEFQASALLSDQVENLIKSNGVGAVLLVRGSCEYGGSVTSFDASVTRLRVVSKTEKELVLVFHNFPEPIAKPVQRAKPTPTPAQPSPTPTPYAPTPTYKKLPSSSPTPYATPRPTPYTTPMPKPASDAMKRFNEAVKKQSKPERN